MVSTTIVVDIVLFFFIAFSPTPRDAFQYGFVSRFASSATFDRRHYSTIRIKIFLFLRFFFNTVHNLIQVFIKREEVD